MNKFKLKLSFNFIHLEGFLFNRKHDSEMVSAWLKNDSKMVSYNRDLSEKQRNANVKTVPIYM